MTTAETDTPKRRTAARAESGTALSNQLLDAGSALAERTVSIARNAAESSLKVTDAFVLGSLGVAEEWAGASPVAGLAVPPVKVAKDTWTTTREGLRDLVLAV